jgi:cell division protein FtsA
MNPNPPIGIVELGSINIKCLIFKITQKNEVEVLSTSIVPSEGIHNDVIINLAKACSSIRKCVSDAENKISISLKKINILFEQSDFLCTKFSKHKNIDGAKIYKDDIDFLLKEAKKQLMLNDKNQSIIHIFNHNYIVDGKIFIEEPIDVYANTLTHEMTFITAPQNNLKNINQVFADCDLEIERLISRTFALGASYLNHEELKFGSIIIDLGFEKISLGLFKNFALIHSITFPIGINHIKKDISKVCSLTLQESENIINHIDFSFQDNQKIFDKDNYLKKDFFTSTNYRKISQTLVIDIIKSRLDEIIQFIKKNILIRESSFISGARLMLAGGGSNLLNIELYFLNLLGNNIKNAEKKLKEDFGACLGAVKIIKDGWETEALPNKSDRNIEKKGFFAKVFNIYS